MNNKFMQKALELAELAYHKNEVPVGAIIVSNNTNEIISATFNLVETNANALAHAEILAINEASNKLKSKYLYDYSIFCTLEPCTMCAGAISLAKLSRLYYGLPDIKQGAVENGVRFFTAKNCLHRPDIYPGIETKKYKILLTDFFKKLR